jgi:hypothetical protein
MVWSWVSVHCGQHLRHKAPDIWVWAFDCFKNVILLAGDLPPRHAFDCFKNVMLLAGDLPPRHYVNHPWGDFQQGENSRFITHAKWYKTTPAFPFSCLPSFPIKCV